MSRLIDLFSGIGGFEISLRDSNFEPAFVVGSRSTGRKSNILFVMEHLLNAKENQNIALSVEDMGDVTERMLADYYCMEELEPQKKGLRVKRHFLLNDERMAEGFTRRSSRGASFAKHRVDVINNKKGKEHGLPDSSGLTGMAAVPPNIPVWRVLSDILLDRMFDDGDWEATTEIVDKADLSNKISQGMRFRHLVNGVSVTYTSNGTYYVQHYPGGQNSMSRSLKYMSKEIAALIIYETQIDEGFRKIIEKLNPPTYSNYKILVEELMEEGYRHNPIFDEDEIAYLDEVREEVIGIADSLII